MSRYQYELDVTGRKIEVGTYVQSTEPYYAFPKPLKVTADFGVCLETEDGEVWDNDCHGKPHLQIVEGPAEVEVNWDRGLL